MKTDVKENITKTVNAINAKNPFLLIGIVLLVVFILDYLFVMQFQLGTLRSLSPKIKELSEEVKTTKKNIELLPQFRKELTRLSGELGDINRKIRTRQDIPAILEDISRLANKNGVKIQQIMPNTSVEKSLLQNEDGQYFSIPIIMEARSGYHQFGKFLNQLENEDVLLQTRDFTIAASKESLSHAIKITFDAIIVERPQKN